MPMEAEVSTSSPEDDEGRAHGLERALGQLVDGQLVGEPGQQDGELVAAHPGHGVLAPDGVHQALAHLLDQVVPGGVPLGVVDRFEVVEVDEEHAHRLTDPARPDQLLFDPVLEEAAVGQPGEGVVPGHVRDLLQELQVLQGGGGLVGQAGQPLVEIGVADGRPADPSGPKLAAITPRNSPPAKSGATTEAAMPDRSSRARSTGSSVEPSRTMTSLELSIRSIIGVSERMVTVRAAGRPSGTPSRADGAGRRRHGVD